MPNIVKDLNKNKQQVKGKLLIHLQKIIDDRNYYFEHVFKGDTTKKIYSPINFKRLVENANNNFENIDKSDLHPLYVLDTFDKLEQELIITEHYKSNEVIIPKIIVVPILKNVDETIAGITKRKEKGLKIPPVK